MTNLVLPNRDQLSQVFKDPKIVKAFENLFNLLNQVSAPNSDNNSPFSNFTNYADTVDIQGSFDFYQPPISYGTMADQNYSNVNITGGSIIGILLGIFMLSSSIAPINNGDFVIQITSNTQVTFKYKGTDGIIRTASLTLV